MNWTEVYQLFEFIVEKHGPHRPDEIENDMNKLYQILHGFEPFDIAYAKWLDSPADEK